MVSEVTKSVPSLGKSFILTWSEISLRRIRWAGFYEPKGFFKKGEQYNQTLNQNGGGVNEISLPLSMKDLPISLRASLRARPS